MSTNPKLPQEYGTKGRELHIEDAYQIFMNFLGMFWWEALRPKMIKEELITTENNHLSMIEKYPPKKKEKAFLYLLNSEIFSSIGSRPLNCTNNFKDLILKMHLMESDEGVEDLQISEENLFQLVIDFCRFWNERWHKHPDAKIFAINPIPFPVSFGINMLEEMRKCPESYQEAWKVWNRVIDARIIEKRTFTNTSFKARVERSRGGLGDLSCLLEEAKFGTLSDEEFSYLVERLKKYESETDSDIYSLIYAIGKADLNQEPPCSNPRGLQHRKLIEGFLYYPKDPMVSSRALAVLCRFWELTGDYLEIIRDFLVGINWDEGEEVQLTAISVAGEYLHDYQVRGEIEIEMIQLIAAIAEDETKNEGIREMAYQALARASGASWEEIYAHPTDEEEELKG